MKNLEDYRKEIDHLDEEIIRLLGERLKVCVDIKKYKEEYNINVEDKKREDDIKNKVLSYRESEIIKDKILEIYSGVIKASKDIQMEKRDLDDFKAE